MTLKHRLYTLLILISTLLAGCLDTSESDFDREVREADEMIQAYLEENGIEAERQPSGVYIEVLEENEEGQQVVADHVVGITYEMRHLEGDYVVEAYEDSENPLQFSFAFSQVYNAVYPAGLNYEIGNMRLGEIFRFYIPSYQAYGSYSHEDFFDEFSHFIMDVELVDLKTEDEVHEQEMEAIHEYLETLEHEAQAYPNGLYYVVLEEGDGDSPQSSSNVELYFTRKYLDGTVIEADSLQMNLGSGQQQLVPGFETGLLLMQEGEKAELIMPSRQAFGRSVQVIPTEMREDLAKDFPQDIPLTKPFSPVIYEVELISVD